MKALILAAALAYVAVCQAQQTTCVDAGFQACSAGLATALNISYIGLFNDYPPLQSALQNMFTQNIGDISGLVTACNALHQFYLCLGSTQIQYCLGLNGLIGKGLSPAQAYGIDGLLTQYQFMCGAGFYTALYNNLDCLQRVTLNYNATLWGCQQTYLTNIMHDPAQGCTYTAQEIACYQAPFRQLCSPNQNVAAWWACEGQRNRYFTRFFCPDLQCSLMPSSKDAQYLLDNHKEENGFHMFKLPDVFEQNESGEWALKDGKWVTG